MTWGSIGGAVAATVVGSVLAPDGGGGGGGGGSQADAAAAQAALKQSEIAEKQWNYYEQNFQPFEKDVLLPAGRQLMELSNSFGSQAEQEKAAGEASTTMALSMGKARDAMGRNLASYGVNPNSGRFQDANLKMSLEGAKADAGAQNMARKGIRDEAFGKKIDSINTAMNIGSLGRGLPSSAMTGLSSAAATNANIGNQQFLRSEYQAQQARSGLAPITSAVSRGVEKNWFNAPAADTYNDFTARAVSNGFNFTDMSDPAYG